MVTADEVRKLNKESRLVIGQNSVIRSLKKGVLERVLVAKNCPEIIKERVKYYSKLLGITIEELRWNNEELGSACKKPFTVNIVGIKSKIRQN